MSETIVVGVDGSECSARAVQWVATHAAALGATVRAVHAIEDPVYAVPPMAAVTLGPLPPEVREEIRAQLEQVWCKPLADAGVTFTAELVDGPPAGAMLDAAKRAGATLLVVGRRGRGGFAELILGSVSHQLSHHAARPLVIVP